MLAIMSKIYNTFIADHSIMCYSLFFGRYLDKFVPAQRFIKIPADGRNIVMLRLKSI